MSLKLYNPKKDKLVDTFEEKNINNIVHLLEPAAKLGSTSVYSTIGWQCSLRGDRLEKRQNSPNVKKNTK